MEKTDFEANEHVKNPEYKDRAHKRRMHVGSENTNFNDTISSNSFITLVYNHPQVWPLH